MKKMISLLLVVLFATTFVKAQSGNAKVEVLYFKANLTCCKARTCNAIEADIKSLVESKYADGKVVFKQVKIADSLNAPLVSKYNAQSQSVIIRKITTKKDVYFDASDIVKQYYVDLKKDVFEQQFLAKVNELLKK